MKHPGKIILLAVDCDYTNLVYNDLCQHFDSVILVIENNVSKRQILSRRIKNLGIGKVFGQILFQLFVPRLLKIFSTSRITEILKKNKISFSPVPAEKIVRVKTVNSQETITLIRKFQPDVIVVNGTRIISKEVIEDVQVKMVNIHVGITPRYRGVHGAYWALVNNDRAHCGVTIHYINTGIDTGGILSQTIINPHKKDNFITYPYLQFAAALAPLKDVLKDILSGKELEEKKVSLDSKLWYHPTIFQYCYHRIFKGVK